ncbi:MAG: hypothetical protein KAH56_13790 [Candidatus Krumholzibacteria bacterium]|nr:hypothetical protein [Candidatus Krumholzibacteria bacterium]
MRRIILLTFVLCLVASTASAGSFGLRGGYTLDPDQFHIGGHYDVGQIFNPIRLVPNVEIGFGDNVTLFALNADFIWDIPESAFSVGAEVGLNISSWDSDHGDSSDSDLGLGILGDWRFAEQWFGEVKLGLVDSPDVKLTVGYNF